MTPVFNFYEIASDRILEFYLKNGHKIVRWSTHDLTSAQSLNHMNFVNIFHYKWSDIEVSHKVNERDQFDLKIEHWQVEINELLLPITRELKLNDLGV